MSKHYIDDIITTKFHSQHQIIQNTFPDEIGKDRMDIIKTNDDFFLVKSNFYFKQKISMKSKQNDKKLVITASLKGNMDFKNHNGLNIPFKEGYTTISSLKNVEGQREYQKSNLQQIRLVISENFLKRNLKEEIFEKYINNQQDLQLIDFYPTSLASQFIIKDIVNANFDTELGYIYSSSKALELLYVELSKLGKDKINIALDKYDINAIYKAKEILLQNMQNPPSIVELAKLVHLNEFKLKKGFKQVFGTTPFNLLYEQRMKEAKELLLTSDYTVGEVAKLVGYKFANNFTNSFLRKFGQPPKSFKKMQFPD